MPSLPQCSRFSGAFCVGLIEAVRRQCLPCRSARGFPALFAPASLKPALFFSAVHVRRSWFSGAFCAGLIEAYPGGTSPGNTSLFSGAFCAGLIEAAFRFAHAPVADVRFPELFAPASLKQGGGRP